MKPIKTWIVMADAGTVRIAVNDGPGKGVYGHSVKGVVAPDVTELSDEPGLTNAPTGPNRGSISDPDFKTQASAEFANRINDYLDAAQRAGKFQRLVLIAAPAMLGQLRQKLSPHLKDVLRADIPKDLVHAPLEELPGHLAGVMAV